MAIQSDVAILGGGPGGYTAAIRAAQLGKKVVIVEMDKLGGTCLHKGCIPSKALLRSAEVYRTLMNAAQFGVALEANSVTLDYKQVNIRKEDTVNKLHQGLRGLMKKNGITFIEGKARVVGPSIFSPKSGTLAVELADGEMESVVSENLIIASGSRPRIFPGLEPDGEHIMTSDDALAMEILPASLLIVGGGVIGVEWASLLCDFGVEVTLVETAGRLLPSEDADISAELAKQLKKRGVKVILNASIQSDSFEKTDTGIIIKASTSTGEAELRAAKILVSIGRVPNADDLGLENTDVLVESQGIKVNAVGQTREPHIYAIGDVIGGVQLAHAASSEGIIAAEHIAGLKPIIADPLQIPRCVYSFPEVASIGMTEEQAQKDGRAVKIGKVPFLAIGKAIVQGETDGFVKVVCDKVTDDILGIHIIGAHATELIGEAALAGWLNAAPWEVGRMVHAHPTLSEAIGEAMLAADGNTISL